MKNIKILIQKELESLYNGWGVYIGYTLFLLVCGFTIWFSFYNIFHIGQASMIPIFTTIKWTNFLLLPTLTMRCFAEEKQSGTLELLLTKPINISQLIAAKFHANLIVILIELALTLPYYITMSFLGKVDTGSVLLGYLGLIMFFSCYISIGMFASSIARSAVSAFFISLGIGLCFQLLFDFVSQLIGSCFLAELFLYLSLDEHYESLARGVLDTRDIVYLISVTTVFLIFTKLSLLKYKYLS